MNFSEMQTLDDYLMGYGKTLGQKAMAALRPLHTPGVDPLPDMDELLREPFPAQQDVIAAASAMMRETGNGFVVGEMGTGKTLIGMSACHAHAGGKPYRAVVLCPDHLISKWVREIETTIPGAVVHRFENWKAIVGLMEMGRRSRKTVTTGGTTHTVERASWVKPLGPEWYVVGRNQAKWMPNWIGLGEEHKGFESVCSMAAGSTRVAETPDGTALVHLPPPPYKGDPVANRSSKPVIVAREAKKDEKGKDVRDRNGEKVMVPVVDRHYYCPRCGTVHVQKDGTPTGAAEFARKQLYCQGLYLQEIPDPEDQSGKEHNFERVYAVVEGDYNHRGVRRPGKSVSVSVKWKEAAPGRQVKWGGKLYVARKCGEPLWNWTNRPYRWSPARIIHKKLRRAFQYLLIDEVHEQKSDESAQSMAAGKLMSAARHTLALTGTLIGGYANHMFPLMVRMTPDTLKAEGFEWGKDMPFSQAYGRVDRIVTSKLGEDCGTTVGKNQSSMRRARNGGRSSERQAVRPGVMPTLFGRHMIGSSIFITLEELAAELPGLHEYVGGPLRPQSPGEPLESYEHYKRLWVDVACDMDDETRQEYDRIEGILTAANRELLKKGSMKLLGATLYTLLDYPDRPFGWTPDFDGELAVGYYVLPKNFTQENWHGVVQPADLDPDVIRPKERKLIDICKANKSVGNQCWVYCQMTGKRDVMRRLKGQLEAEGLRVGILRADTVNPKEREDWITANGGEFDVVLSHPKLVSTGLDLFSKDHGGHNFNTIVFYETGYNLFDMRQAARRSWRIGQPKECQVYYLHYRGGMQHKAMMLMSRKMAAATALEGEFSTEGLVAMAGEDNAQMAMARTLSGKIDDGDIQRNWGKVSSAGRKLKKPALMDRDVIDVLFQDSTVPRPGEPSPFDSLPAGVQLVAETIAEFEEDLVYDEDELLAAIESYQPKPTMQLVGAVSAPAKPAAMSRDEIARMMADLADLGLTPEDLL